MAINSINFTGNNRNDRSRLADGAAVTAVVSSTAYLTGRHLLPVKSDVVNIVFSNKVYSSYYNETKATLDKDLRNAKEKELGLVEELKNFAENKSAQDLSKGKKEYNPTKELGKIRKRIIELKKQTPESVIQNTIEGAPKQYIAGINNQCKKVVSAYGGTKKCIEGITKEIKMELGKKFAIIGATVAIAAVLLDSAIKPKRR